MSRPACSIKICDDHYRRLSSMDIIDLYINSVFYNSRWCTSRAVQSFVASLTPSANARIAANVICDNHNWLSIILIVYDYNKFAITRHETPNLTTATLFRVCCFTNTPNYVVLIASQVILANKSKQLNGRFQNSRSLAELSREFLAH